VLALSELLNAPQDAYLGVHAILALEHMADIYAFLGETTLSIPLTEIILSVTLACRLRQ
jgi:hypothetical protein